MYRKARREALEIIRRFVRGEIEEEPLLGFVRDLELRSIQHLFETLELGDEDIRKISLIAEDLARPIREFLAGTLSLDALRRRTYRISQIVSAAEGQGVTPCCLGLGEALNLLGLVLDSGAPLSPSRISGYLVPVLSALDSASPAPFHSVMAQVLRDVGTFHFTTLSLLEVSRQGNGRRLPWSDLALLYGPPEEADPRGDRVPEANLDPVWFIPLSVTTRRFYEEGLPARIGPDEEPVAWTTPRSCRIGRLRQICPSLPFDRYRPSFFIDPRGFTEIVLDVEELSFGELIFAVQLFSIHHGARAATLEGQEVKVYPMMGHGAPEVLT